MAASRMRILVYGGVQGVGFRDFVRRRARDLELDGYVRNLADGTVELEATGTSDALARLRDLVAQGPSGATVSHVREIPTSVEQLPSPFAITW
jgi:acylphosphatase